MKQEELMYAAVICKINESLNENQKPKPDQEQNKSKQYNKRSAQTKRL
ncbi:hypothetical protein M2475_000193 [Breznakia sp. PF5-3]|nr:MULTISPECIES: hypothetical protein [unclassified Breznakia]MDL2276404.1 hypothetical protein [Breznakia sp. OttesenSCG-928-G09]MDF9823790.1 hypothetical protein [Breznakia sp. PM6-1]MDF9834644.1 hypothetical protein [Breznakia sp. PF5-3]MDF9836739.1 hypothetical protein [Breznakia sp. PFB2-8]MDF9858812.1 hypothetical protein [Breznakia sp. PH5-24]